MRASLYIHIPFCKSKCSYCDFFSLPVTGGITDDYIDLLLKEALYRARAFEIDSWKTVYIGGGTPSLLSGAQLTRLMNGVRAAALLQSGAEVTIEANPDTVTRDFLHSAREAGINRLSLGVQSLDDAVLKGVARRGTRETILSACELIADSFCIKDAPPNTGSRCTPKQNAPRSLSGEGATKPRPEPSTPRAPKIHAVHDTTARPESSVRAVPAVTAPRFSVDLIAGLPYQSPESLYRDIDFVTSCGADHVSLYALTLEENTPLFRAAKSGAIPLPPPDFADELWLTGRDLLEKAGFLQYEVSNFAKRGYESAHNLSYWQSEAYVGLGAGGTGTVGAYRYTNKCDIALWANGFVCDEETLCDKTRLFEFCMMGFRLRRGIEEAELTRRFGVTKEALNPVFDTWARRGAAVYKDGWLFLTKDGILLLNAFLTELAEFML